MRHLRSYTLQDWIIKEIDKLSFEEKENKNKIIEKALIEYYNLKNDYNDFSYSINLWNLFFKSL